MTSDARDKCDRLAAAAAAGVGADATTASCVLPAICATKNIAHGARGAQSPPPWQVAAAEDDDGDDDDRCSGSGAQTDAPLSRRPGELGGSHKVTGAHRRGQDSASASDVDANLGAAASSISDLSQQQQQQHQREEQTLRRCEIFERWREHDEDDDHEREPTEAQESDHVAEWGSPTDADEIGEMGAHLSGREATSEEEEDEERSRSGCTRSVPRASRAQRSVAAPMKPAGTPTVLNEAGAGYAAQQPTAPRDKRPRRARTTHAASNSAAAAAGASAIAPAIAPTTIDQNRMQSSTTSTMNLRNSNVPIDSQLFSSANNKFTSQHSSRQNVTTPARPASAMAGSVGSACKPDYWATCNPSPASTSRTPPPPATSSQRVKTTRVRINSTSEQIQDPNWLIQMSREFELKQQSKRAGFPALKSLQQKLKSTIVGSSSSSSSTTTEVGSQSGACEQNQSTSNATHSQKQDYPGATSSSSSAANSSACPPPVPMTPVKMPVSILKQPGTGRTPLKSAQAAGQHAKSPIIRQQTEGVQARPSSRNQSTGKTAKQQSVASSNRLIQPQTTTSKQTSVTKQTSGKRAATGPAMEPSETLTKQATAANATQPTEAASARNNLSNPAKNSSPSGPTFSQSLTITTQTATTTSPPTQQSGDQQPTPSSSSSSSSTSRPMPICADGQVKVSGWKRNNLLAKTLSHFDEIRGNQRPIFMPTKITLPPDKRASSSPNSASGSTSPQPISLSPLSASHGARQGPSSSSSKSKAAADLAGATRFAGIVREAILKKSLLAGAHNSGASPTKRVSQDAAGERRQSCDLGAPAANCQLAQETAGGSSPAKRPVSADPARSSVSSLSGGGGQPKIQRKQLYSDSTGQQAHSQQASPSHRQQQRESGPRTSITQIIAAAVAATSNEPAAPAQRSSFSLPSASVAASSSRAFKLQLKNEQVLQQLRRQSNEHRESLTIDLNNNNNNTNNTGGGGGGGNLRQESGSSANEAGGGSVRLKDWKRLTSKLGLLAGRSERQMFAGAVRSSAGTPVQSSSLAANPLRLTVSNQESRRLGARSGHRGSGCGESSPVQAAAAAAAELQSQANRSRLLVPGGYLFDASNRRHSSQSSDVSGAAMAPTSSPASERKLSSSSMVVQPVSVPGTASLARRKAAAVASPPDSGHLKPSGGFNQRERRRIMSRSAAASPMLMAHQDSMCLRRSSDSEACGAGSGVAGSRLQVVMGGAATPVTSDKKDGGSSSRSSMSGASVFYGGGGGGGGDPQRSSLGSATSGGGPLLLTAQTRPVVVNRVDLLHLLKVTGSGVSLNVVPSSDEGAGAAPAACEDIQQAAGMKDTERAHEDGGGGSQETAAIGGNDIGPHEDNNAQQLKNGNGDEQALATRNVRNDLSWVVRRTSKVAVFQQKLRNKMRWHSKQKQAGAVTAAELDAREKGLSQPRVALNDDDDDGGRCMINEANKENNSMGGGGIEVDADADRCSHEETAKNASAVLMDPTLIGDAIETFLRTTMQQQQQLNSSECRDQDETQGEHEDQIELGEDERADRTSPLDGELARPLDGSAARRRLMAAPHGASGEAHQAADTAPSAAGESGDSIGPIERVSAPPLPLVPPPPPSVVKKNEELRQKQQQQQQAPIGGSGGGNNQAQLANKRTKTQIQAATG